MEVSPEYFRTAQTCFGKVEVQWNGGCKLFLGLSMRLGGGKVNVRMVRELCREELSVVLFEVRTNWLGGRTSIEV
jgi:hypothetical protein